MGKREQMQLFEMCVKARDENWDNDRIELEVRRWGEWFRKEMRI